LSIVRPAAACHRARTLPLRFRNSAAIGQRYVQAHVPLAELSPVNVPAGTSNGIGGALDLYDSLTALPRPRTISKFKDLCEILEIV
jgi:hypothetical protein